MQDGERPRHYREQLDDDALIDGIARAVAVGVSIPGRSVCQHDAADIATIIRASIAAEPQHARNIDKDGDSRTISQANAESGGAKDSGF